MPNDAVLPAASPSPTVVGRDDLPFTAADLGFASVGDGAWRKTVGGIEVTFRLLERVPELLAVEDLQRQAFGVSDRDLVPASELVVVPETGGAIVGAFLGDGPDDELVGVAVGWGGFVGGRAAGRPRLVSDMLAVRVDRRNAGLGAEIKKLQGAIALAAGFPEMVWTVDPLRAGNARLNLEKLGAHADRYEVDRYGTGYGAGLYGQMPTDRLHITWPLTSPRVRDRLLGRTTPLARDDVADLAHFAPAAGPAVARALVYLPADIDRLLAWDPNSALRWRLTLREALQLAFAQGFAITGFVSGIDAERDLAAYVIERDTGCEVDRRQ